MSFQIQPIGFVESSLTDPDTAARQADEGAPEAWLMLQSQLLPGLRGVQPGDAIFVITWLDRARRDVLSVHPRGDLSRQPQGVFSTRSPHRPNPIGLHRVEVVEIAEHRVRVRSLEALHGTPIIDIKPVLSEDIEAR